MRPLSISFRNVYFLLTVDYVSKWVEAISTRMNEARIVIKVLREDIIPRYGMPHTIIGE